MGEDTEPYMRERCQHGVRWENRCWSCDEKGAGMTGVIEPVVPLLAGERQVGGANYLHMGIQPWSVIEANGMDYFEGRALHYLMRWRTKNGTQDLRKCIHYLEKIIEREEAGFYKA